MIIANGINMVAKLEAKMRASKFKSYNSPFVKAYWVGLVRSKHSSNSKFSK